MERTTRKGGTRNAPGWRFDADEVQWICDQHGSPTCTVCDRPQLTAGDDRTWLIDPDGVMMPEPQPIDLLPDPPRVVGGYDGALRSAEIVIDMRNREVADITSHVEELCRGPNFGLVNVFLPHATAGLAIIELGHGTEHDIVEHLETVIPLAAPYASDCGRRDEGADHLMPVVLAPSITIPVIGGRPVMSESQSVVLVDRFHPMKRRIVVTFVPARD